MSSHHRVYTGRVGTTIIKHDIDGIEDDNATNFQAYVKTRGVLPLQRLGKNVRILEPMVIGAVEGTSPSITFSFIKDFGAKTISALFDFTPQSWATSAEHIMKKVDGACESDMGVVQLQVGDGSAQRGQWQIEALLLNISEERDK